MKRKVDIAIIGGSLGGVAAALSATKMGYKVLMTEECTWVGGQMTSQAVPPDENFWVDTIGASTSYQDYRQRVRQYYKENYELSQTAQKETLLNPGGGSVSRLCHEPRVAHAVLMEMLNESIAANKLEILTGWVPLSADVEEDVISAVKMRNVNDNNLLNVEAAVFIDATELGDLLPITGTEYVTGAESRQETMEPHAIDGPAEPENVQAITWCAAISYDPSGSYEMEKPADYDFWKSYIPKLEPAWPGPLLDWTYSQPRTLRPYTAGLLPKECTEGTYCFWRYRRIIESANFQNAVHEATIVNWPQNDYILKNVIDKSWDFRQQAFKEAKQLTLSLVYWLKTTAPRPNGKQGFPGLYLNGQLTGTEDGMAQYPYIRESRRIKGCFTVTENHVGKSVHDGSLGTEFADSVGIGSYNIDLHPSTNGKNYIDVASLPFQIPLGALIPIRMKNLLPACKNISSTHISNGCYRLHPVEWNIGEVAGTLAACSLQTKTTAMHIYENKTKRETFQKLLQENGVRLAWPKGHNS